MIEYTQEHLDFIHSVLLKQLKFIHYVCEKHNISYRIWSGTCLGAIREKGFIPWDDDADIMMTRDEFNQFHTVAEKELLNYPCDIKLSYYRKSVKSYRISYEISEQEKVETDIFVVDKLPESQFKINIIRKRIALYRFMFRQYRPNLSFPKKVVEKLLMFYGKLIGGDKAIQKHFDKFITKYDNRSDLHHYINSTGLYKDLLVKVYTDEMLDGRILVDFCDTKLYAPKNYDAFLTCEYGKDYMTPPPVEERQPAHNRDPIF